MNPDQTRRAREPSPSRLVQICQRQNRYGLYVCAQAFIDSLPQRLCPNCRLAPALSQERQRLGLADWPRDANGAPLAESDG
jgi:hypothetical protein